MCVKLCQGTRSTNKGYVSVFIEFWASQMCRTIRRSWDFGEARKVDAPGKHNAIVFINKVTSINSETAKSW